MGIIGTLLAKKATGRLLGLIVSKTQWGASLAAGTGLLTVLPQALAGDDVAIGQVATIVVGWLVALYGRLKAKL